MKSYVLLQFGYVWFPGKLLSLNMENFKLFVIFAKMPLISCCLHIEAVISIQSGIIDHSYKKSTAAVKLSLYRIIIIVINVIIIVIIIVFARITSNKGDRWKLLKYNTKKYKESTRLCSIVYAYSAVFDLVPTTNSAFRMFIMQICVRCIRRLFSRPNYCN